MQLETTALPYLMDAFRGTHWAVLLSDVSGGDKGNSERLAYPYDTRRVVLSGLAGEIVLQPAPAGLPEQFDRTPYIAGFRAANEHVTLLTAHIRYGALPADRLPELQRIATYTANELRTRARTGQSREEPNLLVRATSTSFH